MSFYKHMYEFSGVKADKKEKTATHTIYNIEHQGRPSQKYVNGTKWASNTATVSVVTAIELQQSRYQSEGHKLNNLSINLNLL